MATRFAVLSDVHGNRFALQAVLDDIDRRHISHIVNLGDSFYGPLDPAGTADLLLKRDIPTVRGNEDRLIVEPAPDPPGPTLHMVRKCLSAKHYAWLESLPSQLYWGDAYLCHGMPVSDTDYLLWEVGPRGAVLRRASAVASLVGEISCPLVLCGHDHVPRVRQLANGVLVVDPGSVGLPAYADDQPLAHVMETGTPHARYAIVSSASTGWMVEDVAIPYDWAAAAVLALENGRPDWAEWLRTGEA